MPTLSTIPTIDIFERASDITPDILLALAAKAHDSNVVLPQIMKSLKEEEMGDVPVRDQMWMTCRTHGAVDLVLTVTDGPIGKYPIFIVFTRPLADLTHEFLFPRLISLVSILREYVPVKRVFSVFAPESIAKLFTDLWTEATGVGSYSDEPYYAAKLSYCTKRSLVNKQMTLRPDFVYDLRPAVDEDIMAVAELCHDFAAESDPFVLTPDAAIDEATILVNSGQVWVHRICELDGTGSAIASIVAFTRNTEKVATISKVFTNPKYRRRGCAERLVRRVCKHLLLAMESVVLYVGHDNPAANVYARVGFAGLAKNSAPVEGVDRWLEIGFDRTKVDLGHW